jgi:hypothetical protein
MEALRSSETSVFTGATRSNIPEGGTLLSHRHENLICRSTNNTQKCPTLRRRLAAGPEEKFDQWPLIPDCDCDSRRNAIRDQCTQSWSASALASVVNPTSELHDLPRR